MRKFKGYMTLEATLIVPMVICVFVLLIYFTYYLYGRCLLSQDCYILAFRACITNQEKYEGEPEKYVMEKRDQVVGKKYFGSTRPVFEVDSSDGGKNVRVKGQSGVRHRAMGVYFLKPQSGWEYEAAGRARNLEPVKHIRKIKRLLDIGKNGD